MAALLHLQPPFMWVSKRATKEGLARKGVAETSGRLPDPPRGRDYMALAACLLRKAPHPIAGKIVARAGA